MNRTRAEDAIAGEQVAGPGPIRRRNAARIRTFPSPRTGDIAPASATGWRAPTAMSAVPPGRAHEQGRRVGRIGAVAVDQDDRVAIGQQREDRADGVALALLGDRLDDPNAHGPATSAGAVGRVVVEDDDLGVGQRSRGTGRSPCAIAAASL